MKVSCNNSEYVCVNEREVSATMSLKEVEMEKVHEFKYLGVNSSEVQR